MTASIFLLDITVESIAIIAYFVNRIIEMIVSSVFSIKSKIFYFLFKIALKIDEKPSVIPSKPTTLAENGYTFDGR